MASPEAELEPPATATCRPAADTRMRQVTSGGTITIDQVTYKIDVAYAFEQVLVVTDPEAGTVTVTDLQGEVLAEHTRPAPGVRYVGNGRPPGTRPKDR